MRTALALVVALLCSLAAHAQGGDLAFQGSVGGGGGSSDAQTIDGLDSTALITTSLTTNTTAITMNVAGTGIDYTCASASECRVFASGAANLVLGGGNGQIQFTEGTGIVRAQLSISNPYQSHFALSDGTGAWQSNIDGMYIGYRLGVSNNTKIGGIAKAMSGDWTHTDVVTAYGNGKVTILPETVTCPSENGAGAATETYDPASSNVLVVNNDANGCEITPLETTAVVNSEVTMKVITSAGGTVKIMDSANVSVATASCDTVGVAVGGRIFCDYVDAANDYYDCNCYP